MWSGLSRLSGEVPPPPGAWITHHGPLMVCGFFGTLIGLERAAVSAPWTHLAPLLGAAGALSLLADFRHAPWIVLASAAALAASILSSWGREPRARTALSLAGAVCWIVGILRWKASGAVPDAAPWWVGFLFLVVSGELGTAPLPRAAFERACVGSAALWALASGAFWALGTGRYGFRYDAALHAFLLGSLLPMVFAHAPAVLREVAGVVLVPRRRFWIHFGLLHASLLLRISGDLLERPELQLWGGVGNALAVLAFLANLASSRS